MPDIRSQEIADILSVELYTDSEVLNAQIACPMGSRLLDIFNNVVHPNEKSTGEFIELVNIADYVNNVTYLNEPKEYIRKTSIHLIAVTDAEIGRGKAHKNTLKTYPFVCKAPRSVSIQLERYTLSGFAYLRQGQSMQELLNDTTQFLPLTDVTVARDCHFYGNRPFAIINKQLVFSIQEQQFNAEIPPGGAFRASK
jgi:hypothetical protein